MWCLPPFCQKISLNPCRISKNRSMLSPLMPRFSVFSSLSGWDPWSIRHWHISVSCPSAKEGKLWDHSFLNDADVICDTLSGSLLSHPFKTRHHTEMLQHPFNFQMQSKWDLDKINAKTRLMLRKRKKKSSWRNFRTYCNFCSNVLKSWWHAFHWICISLKHKFLVTMHTACSKTDISLWRIFWKPALKASSASKSKPLTWVGAENLKDLLYKPA